MNLTLLMALAATSAEAAICFVCARNLWRLQRENWDRSRRMLAMGSLFCGLIAVLVLFGNMVVATHELPFFLLQPWVALLYMSMNIVMVLYPISVIRPDWLTPRHFTYLFLPVVILAVIFSFYTDRWTLLYAPEHIIKNITQPDVLARLAALFIMIPYCLIPLVLPYKYYHSSANHKWTLYYSLALLGITLTHIALMLTNAGFLLFLMPALAATFYALSTEYELEERLRPAKINPDVVQAEKSASPATAAPMEQDLWSRVCYVMDEEEAWRDPNLSLSVLSQLCATNITYLGRIIQQQTGSGFKEMINAKRVSSVATQIKEDPETDVQTAFFNAGFRSRTTAWRNFKDIMGMSPADYRIALKKH